MHAQRSKPATAQAARSSNPGRPKDLAKRAAILEAAKQLFTQNGYAGVSMDQIAQAAGVSKLTVYSHFGDKDGLFAEVVRAHCEQAMPAHLFEPDPDLPLRERLTLVARAFLQMVMTPEAIVGHRILCSPQVAQSGISELFWDAGPARIDTAFTALLQRRIEAGQLEIPEPSRASCHFFTLLKGNIHAQAVLGHGFDSSTEELNAHLNSVIDLFLRAYAVR